jgi:hypothetical protein
MMVPFTRAALLAAVALTTACTIQETEIPPLAGPSELAMSVIVQAMPDLITRNGRDQSQIVVTARNPNGSPAAGLQFRVDMRVIFLEDFGTLSSRFLVTGSDGRGIVIYTAPPAPPGGSGPESVTIEVRPIGSNQQTAWTQLHSAEIRLVPASTNTPNSPVAAFSYTQTGPGTFVTFNAGGSYPVTGSSIVNYAWNWGDGETDDVNGSPFEDHDWTVPGNYSVTLTVTDNLGQNGSTTRTIVVGP